MDADWALLDRDFYVDAVMYAVTLSGLYLMLVEGADNEMIRELGRNKGFPACEIVHTLAQLGVVRYSGQRWLWCGAPPDPRRITRIDAVRRWVHLVPFCEEALAPWKHAADDMRLTDSGQEMNTFLIANINPSTGMRWLDIGGGTGDLARQLSQMGVDVTMLDTPSVIARCRTRSFSSVRLVAGDVLAGLPTGPFDVVSAVRFLEEFSATQVRQIFHHMRKQLAPNGIVCVISSVDDNTLWSKLFAIEVASTSPKGRTYSVRTLGILAAREHLALMRMKTHGPYTLIVLRRMTLAGRRKDRDTMQLVEY
ncbi:MAG: hypothetical protein C7B44_03180 [Sulfobacillus thermosulfidooxidans]|nr:MAG: hypothetical protein C7B44_03180 [Sulfobacillus thermosulfidooxidans]